MTNEQLKEKILKLNSSAAIAEGKTYLTVTVPSSELYALAKTLKESEDTAFDYLMCLTGVDYATNLGVFYHINSSKHNHSIVLKTTTADRENAEVDSVYSLWKSAEYHEREVFDLLGIKFKNHPDLRRMFLDDDWVGHPLRKDYVDTINIVER
ncbi:MAG: NADH-quinone oxidoreductase chain 5 [Bacteroidetes bacterium GWA2_30_7]|nr:MAG: NADH-quinone oxidoreductase chain 5 [Bacteroidetes bacterium GWA2_30_7]